MDKMDNKALFAALAPRLINKPLFINPAYMPVLARTIEMQLSPDDLTAKQAAFALAQESGPQLDIQNNAAVIHIDGFLVSRTDEFSRYFGLTSYEDISAQFQIALADSLIKSIVFDIASQGGEGAGCFDLVDEIYNARGQKPIYAVFNDYGYSAAFAIASAADKRYISRIGLAGSVGVVAMHVDQSGWDAQIGLAFTYVFAGAHKVDYSSHAPLSPEAKAALQENINAAYDIFVNTVARNLGLTPAAVRATEATIYQGKKAVDIGFADSVMSWNQFMTKLTNRKYGGIMKAELEKMFNDMRDRFLTLVGADPAAAKQEVVTKADANKLVAAAEESAKAEGLAAGKTEGHAAGKKEAQERAKAILEICNLAAAEKDAYSYVIDESLSVEAVRTKVTEKMAAEADRTRIRSTVSSTSTGEVNPVVADAKRRAAAAAGIKVIKK